MSLRGADRSAEPPYAFTAQLWGSMVVSYENGQESTQRLILQELKGPVGANSFSSGPDAFFAGTAAAQVAGPERSNSRPRIAPTSSLLGGYPADNA